MDRRVRMSLLCAGVAAPLVLTGCTSSGSTGSRPPAGPSDAPTSSGPSVMTVSGSADGTTVTLHVGQRLHVQLPTPFWTFQPVQAPHLLRTDATGWVRPTTSCGPPMGIAGCGDKSADYTATGIGRTTVVATREECGEAARCTGNAGRFELHVTVMG